MSLAEKIFTIFTDPLLLKRLLFVFAGILAFRILAAIPAPGVDTEQLTFILSGNQFLGIFDIFSGGALSNFSIAMLGVFPYITVSIVAQLLTSVIPRLHELYHEEGQLGRMKFLQYTRIASAPLAAINAFALVTFFQSVGVLPVLSALELITTISVITAGAVTLMWIGELITEFGIGNGISTIVFCSIVIGLPTLIGQVVVLYDQQLLPLYVVGAGVVLFLFYLSTLFNEAVRPVPITHARTGGTISTTSHTSSYLPIKVNPSGVLPIIFALTIVTFFQVGSNSLASSETIVGGIAEPISLFLSQNIYFALVTGILLIFFSYFHAPIVLNTEKMSESLQKQGAFVPGIRPGEETQEHFNTILFRIIALGALFLVVVTVLPILVQGEVTEGALFALGGSAILIVTSVVLDIYKKIEAHLVTRSL